MTIDLQKLAAPFPPEKIEWRVGATTGDKSKGMALAYIDARDVMERLDEACGPENWQRRYTHADSKTICEIGIRVGDWVWKADGAGDTDFEAEKGAISSAFKRAAVNWGIGRYLYDVKAPWVAIEQRGKSFIIKEGEIKRLQQMLGARSSTGSEHPTSNREVAGSSPAAPANGSKPAVFWDRDNYAIPFNDSWQDWDGLMHKAIDKAPDFAALMKLQKDNAKTLDDYSLANDTAYTNLMGRLNKRGADLSQASLGEGDPLAENFG